MLYSLYLCLVFILQCAGFFLLRNTAGTCSIVHTMSSSFLNICMIISESLYYCIALYRSGNGQAQNPLHSQF